MSAPYHGIPADAPATRRAPNQNGVILWEGPSLLDGSPIVIIATGLAASSANRKTGAMIQTWIIRRDMHPSEAIATGADSGICGDCIHRRRTLDAAEAAVLKRATDRSCYVRMDPVASVYRCYLAGGYRRADAADWEILQGLDVRAGSYGDPAAVPVWIWAVIVPKTGYSHQWRNPEFSALRAYVMASCDWPADREAAKNARWRTFRVREEDEPMMPGEFACPASKEAGVRMDCARCGACNGNASDRENAASPVIITHGSGAKAFGRARLAVLA